MTTVTTTSPLSSSSEPVNDDRNEIGKPCGGADIRNGTVTLPVLMGCIDGKNLSFSDQRELIQMVNRRFSLGGDCERTIQLIGKSNGVEKCRKLISVYFDYCRLILSELVTTTTTTTAATTAATTTEYIDAMNGLLAEFETRRM